MLTTVDGSLTIRSLPGLVLKHPPRLLVEMPKGQGNGSVGGSSTHNGCSKLSHSKKALCSACTCWSFSPRSRSKNSKLLALLFFCTGMGTMCAERHKSPSRIQIGGTWDEPDNQDRQQQTKPPTQNQTPTKHNQQTRTNRQAQVLTSLNEQKGADPRTNTVVKRGNEF